MKEVKGIVRKGLSSFTYLNITQSLVTLNDSIFRLIVAYSLIDLLGTDSSNKILAISAALFVAPFLLFSMPSGQLADRYSKRTVILWTLWAEIVFMVLGIIAIWIRDEYSSYFALFLIALQSSVFNPSKYAILPEIVKKTELSKANSLLTLCTYLSIIMGTFIASFVSDISGRNYVLVVFICLVFSIIALFTGLKIEKTPIQNPKARVNPLFFIQVYKSLKDASKYKYLLLACVTSSYFLFTAAYTQLNLIPFGIQSLGITDVQTGYVFLAVAFGIGMGSLTVGLLSGKKVELGLSLWGACGTGLSYLFLYFLQHHLIIVIFLFFLIGFHGGLYVVPLDAFMQFASPRQERGAIVAAATFLSFAAVLLAAGFLALLGNVLHLQAATGFFFLSLLTLTVFALMTVRIPDQVTRILAIIYARFFLTIHAEKTPSKVLLSAPHRSLLQRFTLIFTFQQIRFFVWKKKAPSAFTIYFYRIFNRIPIVFEEEAIAKFSMKAIDEAVSLGYVLAYFEDDLAEAHTFVPENAIEILSKHTNYPLAAAHIDDDEEYEALHPHAHYFKAVHQVLRVTFTNGNNHPVTP